LIRWILELARRRDLLWIWTLRDIKVRYSQSLLGAAWAILQPLSLMLIFNLVFGYFIRIPTGDIPYPIFSYAALLPWTFLASSMSFALPSLVSNMNLVTKIYFPRETLPVSAVLAGVIDFVVAAAVFAGMLIYYRIPFYGTLIFLPVLVALQMLLTVGIVLFASALNVFYRDIRFVVPLVMQLWMYATPVIYPPSIIPARYRTLYMLNPMAGLIEGYRTVALRGGYPNWHDTGLAALVSLAAFVLGYWYFKRVEWQFADLI
jgi:lipopolysaccharide transport system permease protein